MKIQQKFTRNIHAMDDLEAFLVTAVSTVLALRLFLSLSGYPQIGNSSLHIAHMLWGGLFLLAAFLMRMIFLNKRAERVSVFFCGIGFGLFIDEVGKFVTQDNNYFFRPSVAIIYVVFMLIFLSVRYILTARRFSVTEYLVNSIYEMQELPKGHLREDVKKQILYYLSRSEGDSLALQLRQIIDGVKSTPPGELTLYQRWRAALYERYRRIAESRWFPPLIMIYFPAQVLFASIYFLALLFSRGLLEKLGSLTFSDWAIAGANVLSALLILTGLWRFRRSRLAAFRMFERSILVNIFFAQVFLFFRDQFSALFGLVYNLLILAALHFIIEREKSELIEKAIAPQER